MTVGEKRRFWIPEELAYKGQPRRAARHARVRRRTEVNVIQGQVNPFLRRADVAKAPAECEGHQVSGLRSLAYVTLTKGKGTEKPTASSTRFGPLHGVDDRRKHVRQLRPAPGKPRHVPASIRVIPGWTEMVQLMTVGPESADLDSSRSSLTRASPVGRRACSCSRSSWSTSLQTSTQKPPPAGAKLRIQ